MKNPPSRFCFSKYDIKELLMIAQKKFVNGFTTVELLKEAQKHEETMMQLLNYKGNFMNQKDRTDKRLPFQQDCILSNGFGEIKCKTVDVSNIGVGVLINGTVPFKNGDSLLVDIESIFYRSLANIQWIKEDVNNKSVKVGLKFYTSLFAV